MPMPDSLASRCNNNNKKKKKKFRKELIALLPSILHGTSPKILRCSGTAV
jgi:hypothetical protein